MPDAVRVPPYRVDRMTNEDDGFYPAVGPFLSRREIVGELGAPVWDDDGKVWYVALAEDGGTLGCVGRVDKTDHSLISSLYVVPGGRKQVVGTTLLMRALMDSPHQTVKAHATEASRELFASLGFTETHQRGRYAVMVRA